MGLAGSRGLACRLAGAVSVHWMGAAAFGGGGGRALERAGQGTAGSAAVACVAGSVSSPHASELRHPTAQRPHAPSAAAGSSAAAERTSRLGSLTYGGHPNPLAAASHSPCHMHCAPDAPPCRTRAALPHAAQPSGPQPRSGSSCTAHKCAPPSLLPRGAAWPPGPGGACCSWTTTAHSSARAASAARPRARCAPPGWGRGQGGTLGAKGRAGEQPSLARASQRRARWLS